MILSKETIHSALTWGAKQIITSPLLSSPPASLESEIILAFCINVTKEYLFTYPDKYLTNVQVHEFKKLIRLRTHGKPIAQLTGQKEFYYRIFYVNNQTLIPRPESEEIITTVLNTIELKNQEPNKQLRIADFGTGSGCLAITLAAELATRNLTAKVYAYDISNAALKKARFNWNNIRRREHITNRISVRFISKDFLKDIVTNKFDIIVANPPYIPSKEIFKLPHEIRAFEPLIALDGGPDGLVYYQSLLKILNHNLIKGGFAVFELQSANVKKIRAVFNRKYDSEVIPDLARLPRIILLKQTESPFSYSN